MSWAMSPRLICLAVLLAKAAQASPDHRPNPSSISLQSADIFSYVPMTTVRYATPVPSPLVYQPYAAPFRDVSQLAGNVTYTTYTYIANATATDINDPHGQEAYRALWGTTTFSDPLPFTATVSPTPVASSELIFPPPIYEPGATDRSGHLPSDFVWGVASSAWQYEGGLMDQGRGPSSADSLGLVPGANDSNIADMHYYLYKQDILRLAAIGIPQYSFSIAWSRIVPFGVAGSPINMQALSHYENVIDFCIENGIVPVVTLTHIDTPATLATGEKGPIGYQHTGYGNDSVVPAFEYYARVVMTRFADRVPMWITFNEPNIMADTFHGYYNVLMAHAKVWHFYHEGLNATGQISMKISNNFAFPRRSGNPDDLIAAQRSNDYSLGILLNPTVQGTNYPASLGNTTGVNITQLTTEELSYLNGTVDFLAIDAYSQIFATPPDGGIEACAANISHSLWPICVNTTAYDANDWLIGAPAIEFNYITPTYIRPALKYYNDFYRTPGGIIITEFGFNVNLEAEMGLDERRFDYLRSQYYTNYISELAKASYEDGVPIVGAFGWTFIDNNEWGSYAQRYGMQTVDMATQTRRFKRSMFDYVDAFQKVIGKPHKMG